MERRLLLAVVLSFLLVYVYYGMVAPNLFPPPPVPVDTGRDRGEVTVPKEEPQTPEKESVGVLPSEGGAAHIELLPASPGESSWSGTLSARGGVLESLRVRKDPERFVREEVALLDPVPAEALPFAFWMKGEEYDSLAQAPWRLEDRDGTASARVQYANGLSVVKEWTRGEGIDTVEWRLTIRNDGAEPVVFTPQWVPGGALTLDGDAAAPELNVIFFQRAEGGHLKESHHTVHEAAGAEKPIEAEPGPIEWVVLSNKYFLWGVEVLEGTTLTAAPVQKEGEGAVMRAGPVRGRLLAVKKGEEKQTANLSVIFSQPDLRLAPGEEATARYRIHVLPKLRRLVSAHEPLERGLDRSWISNLLMWILNLCYTFTRNFGLAIILLTLVVKAVLHPLTYRSQKSMAEVQKKMKKLQPKMKEVQEKHKKNPQKQRQEMMKLYQEHGNPMGGMMKGCFPMLLQLPILYALFAIFRNAIELWKAPFFLWIDDLSRQDALMTFDFSLPIVGNHLNLLPILMTVVQFIQMRMTPMTAAPADPDQAKQQKITQYFMVIFFAVIFYKLPSGLVLYWLTTSLFGILEMRYIRRKIAFN